MNVVTVGFELRSNPNDDNGIECICSNMIVAKREADKLNEEFPQYKFTIWGDYEVIEE
jgi:hypothetical protein